MKKLITLCLTLFASFALSAEKLNIGTLNGPSSIPSAYIIENKSSFTAAELDFQIFSGADMELPKLLKGEIDIGVLPPNAAAKVYNASKGKIICLAVIGNGNISLISSDAEVSEFENLRGQRVLCAGKGATPEYMTRYILGKKNITEGDNPFSVLLDFSVPNAEIVSQLVAGKAKHAIVPEPFATVALTKSKNIRRVINLTDEYKKYSSSADYPLTVLVVNKDSLANKKDAVNAYLETYKASVEWTNKNPMEAGRLVEKNTLGLKAPVAAKAIPNAAFVFINADEGRKDIETLLNIFLETSPDSIGSKLPDDGFYYKK